MEIFSNRQSSPLGAAVKLPVVSSEGGSLGPDAKVAAEAKEVFTRFDKNKNNVMEVGELREALAHVDGIKLDEPTAIKVLKAYDKRPEYPRSGAPTHGRAACC